ncbi:hypothetical protein FGE12_03145 [Aggregicoccus sp. 17bor-14]|uniref:hypothetical protein n=1 Tax=Myxococcaceae TaxID=31 RepID=UPI00129CA17D|nr:MULTISPECIES: hypothetical protein [Myxococcaceae]MBF5041369.1 hypothetical protein [Simulacricoccus sp. 17bor-14]MRI87153.1 hypothetical protein [Aggregicoccus sp. 17bor-14]
MSAPLVPLPALAEAALARVRSLETLEAAYAAWLELRLAHGAQRLRWREEAQRLEEQGAFLVGAVRAAAPAPGAQAEALTRLDTFAREAEAKLQQARARLMGEQQAAEEVHRAADAELRAALLARAERYLAQAPPRLHLMPRRVGGGRSVLHLARVTDDAAVLLLRLFTGALPTRYGFLHDEATEQAGLEPAPLYAEEGVGEEETRPDAAALEARLRRGAPFLPVRGFLPLFVSRVDGSEALFRFRQRGPVLEAEVADDGAFRAVLTREEAERCTGRLLRLQLEGRLALEVEVG